jgi:hypothetical protein
MCGASLQGEHQFAVYSENSQRIVLHVEHARCGDRGALCSQAGCLHQVYVSAGGGYRLFEKLLRRRWGLNLTVKSIPDRGGMRRTTRLRSRLKGRRQKPLIEKSPLPGRGPDAAIDVGYRRPGARNHRFPEGWGERALGARLRWLMRRMLDPSSSTSSDNRDKSLMTASAFHSRERHRLRNSEIIRAYTAAAVTLLARL